jgi:predicted dehydrogenase
MKFLSNIFNNMKHWTRRDWLKTLGLATIFPAVASAAEQETPTLIDLDAPEVFEFPHNAFHRPLDKPITCIVIGAGARGNTYSSYTERFKGEMNIVGVAEPNQIRRERFSKRYSIPPANQVNTWEDVFSRPKFADAVMITTPDHLHFGPAMKALEMGYDLLLEKPIAQTWEECKAILDSAKKHKRIVAVCHVLRYTPYFRKMKEIVDSGALGQIISVQHMEPIEHIHMTHSYVRGIWRRAEETNPIILAKSCHDMDILRWIIGKSCKTMVSFGDLSWFKKENAPEGSTMRCTDGCKVETTCAYSALRIYYRERTWLYHFDLPEGNQGPAIMKELTEGRHGRCVYHCDNNVPDHQTCMMEFEGGVTATFNMEALTSYSGRRTRIMGSLGDLVGDEETMTIADFSTKTTKVLKTADYAKITSGHGGGDYSLARDFIQAVAHQDERILTSTIDLSMESHLMGFKAEDSRHQGRVVNVGME